MRYKCPFLHATASSVPIAINITYDLNQEKVEKIIVNFSRVIYE